MEYGIQRRNIYLRPPTTADLEYIFDAFLKEEVWGMFGFEGPAREEMVRRHGQGNLIMAVVMRVAGLRRVGFSICFPPRMFLQPWEYGLVLLDPQDRDAFSAINASDAIAHYFFDHLGFDYVIWRVRVDNLQATIVARRMGYRPFGVWEVGGHRFRFFRLTTEIWQKRLELLTRREEAHPSGYGAAFLSLTSAGFEPEAITSSSPSEEA